MTSRLTDRLKKLKNPRWYDNIQYYRKFDGKRLSASGAFTTPAKAEKWKKLLKKNGRKTTKVRVVKVKGGYMVYSNSLQKHSSIRD